jgi:soluble lytic murein transglycosylase
VQEKSEIPARIRRGWQKLLLLTAFALLISLSIAVPKTAQIPGTLSQYARVDDLPIPEALRALGHSVDHYLNERYEAALNALPDEQSAMASNIGDYVLLYRAKSNLMQDRDKEALRDFRLLESRYPQSPLVEDALTGQCQALLRLNEPKHVLTILKDSRIQKDSEIKYFEARALELAGEKAKAIELYLALYSGYPKSGASALAEHNLQLLSPGALKGKRNYSYRLLRAESLLKANDAQGARPGLLALGGVAAPDTESSQKRILLLADVEYRLGKTTVALTHLRKITAKNPANEAKAIRLEGACYRRLKREAAFLSQRDKALKLYPLSAETEELCYSVATYFDVSYEPAKSNRAYKILYDHFPKGRYAERSLWKLAINCYFQKEYNEAAQGFWRYLLAYPNPATAGSAMYWMGRCYENLGGTSNARYLYGRVQALSNHGYLGQCARTSLAATGKSGVFPIMEIPGINFEKVTETCDAIQLTPVSLPDPSSDVIPNIERARRLWAAELTDLAVFELRWAGRRFPKDTKPLSFIISRIYSTKENYLKAIAGLRDLIPNYNNRPMATVPEEVWQGLFPVRHWDFISAQAAIMKIDPSLILGLIRQESSFNENARSSANARGLMQILPGTGQQLARQAGIKRFTAKKLYQAETNITLGTVYLSSLLRRYGRVELALAAYNAGSSRADLWLNRFGNTDMAEFVEQIPFSETRGYIKQVLSNQALYALLVPSAAPENR